MANILAIDAQWNYIKTLMNQAFAKHYAGKDLPNIDVHHKPYQYLKTDASSDIQRLLAIKARGWK